MQQFFYNTGILLYSLLVRVVALWNHKAGLLVKGRKNTWKILEEKLIPGEKYYWFHAASLGEFEQGRPVMERLKKLHPEIKILLTFYSPSGYEVRKNYAGADVICYLPADTPTKAAKFVRLTNPVKAIFIKYEFWPNYLKELEKRNTPTISISAIFRPDQMFFKWYGGFYRKLLHSFEIFFVQDENSKTLLNKAGVEKVIVAGDTRFDRVADLAGDAKKITLIEQFVKNAPKVIVAGSTWPADEELLIRYQQKHPEVKLIMAPHEIHEGHIAAIEKLTAGNSVRFTEATENIKQSILIVNTIGMLSSVYQYAHIAYIGGGFGVGIHNTLEAAVWNKPVLFGPNHERFREALGLIRAGGAFAIKQYDDLENTLNEIDAVVAGGKAGEYVRGNTGATQMIVDKLI